MHRTIAMTTVLLLSATAAGCVSAEEPGDPPATSVATPTEPTATAADGPPELPEDATEKTTAGAKAFVGFYIELINYGLTHNDPLPLTAASSQECEPCNRIIKSIEENARRGGGQVGGEWHAAELAPVGGQPQARPVIVAAIDVHRGYYRTRANGPRHSIDAKRVIYEFWIQRVDETRWLIQDVRAT